MFSRSRIAIASGYFLAITDIAAAADKPCTPEILREQELALLAFVQEDPNLQHGVVNVIAEIESEYGGEPPAEKQCEIMAKVLEVLIGPARKNPSE